MDFFHKGKNSLPPRSKFFPFGAGPYEMGDNLFQTFISPCRYTLRWMETLPRHITQLGSIFLPSHRGLLFQERICSPEEQILSLKTSFLLRRDSQTREMYEQCPFWKGGNKCSKYSHNCFEYNYLNMHIEKECIGVKNANLKNSACY